MFDVRIVKNFLSKEKCDSLNKAAMLGVEKGWVDKGISRKKFDYPLRYTSRIHMKDNEYPKEVLDISNKIREFCGIDQYPIIEGHGKNGAVVSVTFNGGDTYEHNDPRSECGLYATYRCNVLTQKPNFGGVLFVNGKEIQLEEGDLHCYFASEVKHYVTTTTGDIPRILWMFGAHIPLSEINNT